MPTDPNPPPSAAARLTIPQLLAWAKKYEAVPWSMLAFSTGKDDPGPMEVMRSLFSHLMDIDAARATGRREAIDKAVDVIGEYDKWWREQYDALPEVTRTDAMTLKVLIGSTWEACRAAVAIHARTPAGREGERDG